MEAEVLIKKIEQLPENLQMKAEGYIDALLEQAAVDTATVSEPQVNYRKTHDSSEVKTWLDDFNAPIKAFHDYMYHVDIRLIEKMEKLPLEFQQEIETSVDQLLLNNGASEVEKKSRPVLGSGKDFFNELPDDFDEPMDEMKDYMG